MRRMRMNGRPRVVLSDAERTRVRSDLETIAGRVRAVEEGLQIAAWRAGTNPSEWTEKRLSVLLEVVNELATAVDAAPSDGD